MAITPVGGSFPYNATGVGAFGGGTSSQIVHAITTGTVGDLVIVFCWVNTAGTVSSITDSASAITWQSAKVDSFLLATGSYYGELWWGQVKTGKGSTATNVTVNWSKSVSSSTFGEIVVDEFTISGVAGGTVWAKEASGHLNSQSGATANYPNITSGSATVSGRAYIGLVGIVANSYAAGTTSGFSYNVLSDGSGSVETWNGSLAASTAYAPATGSGSSGAYASIAFIVSATNPASGNNASFFMLF